MTNDSIAKTNNDTIKALNETTNEQVVEDVQDPHEEITNEDDATGLQKSVMRNLVTKCSDVANASEMRLSSTFFTITKAAYNAILSFISPRLVSILKTHKKKTVTDAMVEELVTTYNLMDDNWIKVISQRPLNWKVMYTGTFLRHLKTHLLRATNEDVKISNSSRDLLLFLTQYHIQCLSRNALLVAARCKHQTVNAQDVATGCLISLGIWKKIEFIESCKVQLAIANVKTNQSDEETKDGATNNDNTKADQTTNTNELSPKKNRNKKKSKEELKNATDVTTEVEPFSASNLPPIGQKVDVNASLGSTNLKRQQSQQTNQMPPPSNAPTKRRKKFNQPENAVSVAEAPEVAA